MVEFNERTEQLVSFPSCLIKPYIFCAFTTLIISSLKSVKPSLLNPMFEMLGDAAFRRCSANWQAWYEPVFFSG